MTENEYSGTARPPRVARSQWPPAGLGIAMMWPLLLVILLLFVPLFIWFGCRIEPKAGQIAVLIRKTGTDLPSGQILALPGQKGIQLEVLAEGRTFKNPYTWAWEYWAITDIPAGKLGVQTRLYGADLPSGEIIARENTKGIVAEVLKPGRYRINPYAVAVKIVDAINIKPGFVGVKVSLVGQDVINNPTLPLDQRNAFLVKDGMKGVLEDVLNPGTYYDLNPYMYDVVPVNLQSQRFAVSGDDAINFLTMDGFTVVVEGTIEFAVQREKAAVLTHRVGEMNDIVQKLIVPRMRGFCRIEGSKHPAINFIVGQTRQQFQTDLDAHLKITCDEWGVSIKSVLIRNITPPQEIASIIRDREVAVQESKKYDQEMKQAISKAGLVKQETLAQQNKEKVDADTVRIKAVISAEQDQSVRVIAAQREKQVAGIENEAATAQAKAVMLKAQADADVIRMQNTAEAAVIRSQVKAFVTGLNYAKYTFYTKVGPQIGTVLTTDQEQGLGSLFIPFLPQGKDVK